MGCLPLSRVALVGVLVFALPGTRAQGASVIAVSPVTALGDASQNLQAAIDAAVDGDILLLLPGDCTILGQELAPSIDGKGLTLVAAEGAQPAYMSLRVVNLQAGQQLMLRGLELHTILPGYVGNDAGALRATNCAGTIWVEDCTFTGGNQSSGSQLAPAYTGIAGLRLESCAAVHVTRCTLTGGTGAPEHFDTFGGAFSTRGGYGAGLTASTATFQECTLAGGSGGPGQASAAGGSAGGAGLFVESSHVLFAGSSATGGAKTALSLAPGDGVELKGTGPEALLRAATALAGAGVPAAQDIDAPAGGVTFFPAPTRALVVETPLHEQQAGLLTVQGLPGDLAAFFTSAHAGLLFLPGKQGALELGSPLAGPFLLGVVPGPGGTLLLPFTAPDLFTPGQLGQLDYLQLVVKAAGGPVTFEGGTTFVLLDSIVP